MSKVLIYTDGGSRGNPGIAGSGTVVYAADGTLLREIIYVVGQKASNNVAEYHGMLRGLEAAVELGARDVEVRMDSKLVVEQMSGRWKIKHPDMQALALEARDLMKSLDHVTFTWVPRAKNKEADHLSNLAMDAAAEGHPPGIVGGEASGEEVADGDCDVKVGTPSHWTGASTPPTKLILLRHGQTAMSAAKQYASRTDAELTDIGLEQVRAAAAHLAAGETIDAIVSSPMRRCVQTASAAGEALELDVEIIDDLTERDFGTWEGLTFDEAHDQDPRLHAEWIADPTVCPPGGEELTAMHKRVRAVRRELTQKYPGKTVLVVSHVTPIKSLVRQALDAGPHVVNRMFLDLASISIVEFFDTDARVGSCLRVFNDTSHLRA
ncbi:Phosphoserine phosphatase 1 [Corynebacterium atrinae]|uniref:bifunctional RNase H/acid phosphatase n=1 Tax=Corynebacterium atrinae TaxID=1336740 RepID=UPI0025B61A0F|nr:bifunctional RNase H/acid phosphatase [Corynebacterium atrinae]WJY63889.1 Phosphoserine phosphatase 1 [Corynebacterium atrinae]